jgi:hypothetical protein
MLPVRLAVIVGGFHTSEFIDFIFWKLAVSRSPALVSLSVAARIQWEISRRSWQADFEYVKILKMDIFIRGIKCTSTAFKDLDPCIMKGAFSNLVSLQNHIYIKGTWAKNDERKSVSLTACSERCLD